MGGLDIQIKVLKENSPILFSWWNKETKTVEGCMITCQCQDFGVYYSPSLKSDERRKSEDCVEMFSSEGTEKFAEALQKAEILTLSKEADCGSILGERVRIKSDCGVSVLGSSEGSEKFKKGKKCKTKKGRKGKTREGRKGKTKEGRISLEEGVDCDENFEGIPSTKTDEVRLEGEHEREIKEECATTMHPTEGPESENSFGSKNALKSENLVDKDSPSYQKYEEDGDAVTGTVNEDQMEDNVSENMLEPHGGEKVCDRGIKEQSEIENCIGNPERSNQGEDISVEDAKENTAPILPVNHGETVIEGDVATVGEQIDVSTLSADAIVVLDESKGDMSEVDSALYEALKGIIEVTQANESQPTSWQQISQPIKNMPEKTRELDTSQNMSEPLNPAVAINTPAMIKYREYKNEEYLKRFHKLRTMKKVNTIICEICGAVRTNKSFANHMAAFHSNEERERNYMCEICGKKFLRPENLQRHLLSHTDSKVHCSYCGKSFKHDYNRKAHEKIHWEKPPPRPVRKPKYKTLNPKVRRKPCEIDEYRSLGNQTLEGTLKQEGLKDRKSRQVACSTCGKVVSSKSIRRHIRNHCSKAESHDSKKPTSRNLNVACELCGKVLREHNLKLHMNTVHNPTLVKCEICGKMVRNGSMYGHSKLHTKDKPHKCSYCSATFHFKASLDTHLRKHTKEKPIKCRFCDQTFSRYETRLNHERRHTGERPYKCNLCQKDWKDRGAYKQHMLKYHPGMPMMFKRGPYAQQNQGMLEVTIETESKAE